MKGQSLPINKLFGIMILVIVLLIVAYVIVYMIPKAQGGIDAIEQKRINDAKEKQLADLSGYYTLFMKTEGGIDPYEASVLLAKAIEYTWKDCANFCKKPEDISEFTNFFLKHPIILSKQLDCGNEYIYDKDDSSDHKIFKSKIKDVCTSTDLGTDKTRKADEWTTTIWGLRKNSAMCTGFKADGDQWGNFDCGDSEDSIKDAAKCNPLCGRGLDTMKPERTQNRIAVWEGGALEKDKSYGNIKIKYVPDCTILAGKIPVVSGFLGLKRACIEVTIGSGTDSLATKLSLAADNTKPEKGEIITLSGFLKDEYNNPVAGKGVKIIFDTSFLSGIYSTDLSGSYSTQGKVAKCDKFEVQAKFDGEGMYKKSESAKVEIAPTGGGC